jgi:hypothetical protein
VLDNWIAAEHQLVKRPNVELHEHKTQIEVLDTNRSAGRPDRLSVREH